MNELLSIEQKAWADGRLVIIATIGIGPHTGKGVCCIADRADIRHAIKRIRRGVSPRFEISVASAIREAVSTEDLDEGQEQALMHDLAILMAARSMGAEDHLVEASGLFSIAIAVNPDKTQPWHKRGFINSRDAREAPIGEITA